MAYIGSRVRLESKCGMSDVWYCYLERNSGLFSEEPAPLTQSPGIPPTQPHLHPDHIELFVSVLGWREAHRQFHLRKKMVEPAPEETGDGIEGGPLAGDPAKHVRGLEIEVGAEDQKEKSGGNIDQVEFARPTEVGAAVLEGVGMPQDGAVGPDRDRKRGRQGSANRKRPQLRCSVYRPD